MIAFRAQKGSAMILKKSRYTATKQKAKGKMPLVGKD